MTAFICRHETQVNTQPVTWEGCEEPAAVGIVTEAETGDLMLFPVCTEHAPEELHEAKATMDKSEWAVVSLAYGSSDGGLT